MGCIELSELELRTIYRALKECKRKLEMPERVSKAAQLDINEYESIMDKIEDNFSKED